MQTLSFDVRGMTCTKNQLVQADLDIVFEFTPDCIDAKRLAR